MRQRTKPFKNERLFSIDIVIFSIYEVHFQMVAQETYTKGIEKISTIFNI